MANTYFKFRQFTVNHDRCAMKVTTDACLFGAWCAVELSRIDTGLKTALDVGTGTGLLALMVAQQTSFTFDAVEIDEEAALQAAENIAGSPFASRINVINSDVLSLTKKYNCILSNPPFYETDLRSGNVSKDTAHHSSQLSLVQLISFIENHLTEDGKAFLLLPAKRKDEVMRVFESSPLTIQKLLTVKPAVSHQPIRILLQCGFAEEPMQAEELSIRDEEGNYTEPFNNLLRPYYLYIRDL